MKGWNIKVGHNAVEKFKKFQKVPIEKRYTERVVILFTKAQYKILMDYCHKNNLNKGEFFRTAVVSYLESQNVNLSLEPEADPRQTKIF